MTYDLAIIGSGPAGYSAAIYASRYNLDVLVLGGQQGGLIADAHKVCNYPSQPEIEGSKLGEKMKEHAEKYGAKIKLERVKEIEEDDNFNLKTNLGEEYQARTLILATGTERRKLDLDREEELMGSGISYCATCDGRFFEDDVVGVVGGANAAATAALYLADMAEKVYIVYRRDELRAVEAWKNQIDKTDNIEVIYNANVTELKGEDSLNSVELDRDYNNSNHLSLDGLFVEIGSEPRTELSETFGLELDKKDYIKVDEAQKTSKDKIWAAGDITTNSNYFKQAITAGAEGAVAANSIHKFIKSNQ